VARFLWTQKQDVGPSARWGHAMAYDAVRQRTVLFGGDDGTGAVLRDTWTWDGEFWTQVSDIGPSARAGHGLAWDSARNIALLFGGNGMLGDSWTWDGADWTQVEDSGPTPRYGHAMAFDPVRGQVVLFGGSPTFTTMVNDTWAWDGNAWTQVEDNGPAPRRHAAVAWDGPRQRLVLFGGEGSNGQVFGDTWAWDGAVWTQVEDVGPTAAIGAAMCAGETGLVLFGGLSAVGGGGARTVFDDSWVFDGTHWTQRQDIGPLARWGHTLVRDAQRNTLVLFGGFSGEPAVGGSKTFADTWEHVETETVPGGGDPNQPQPGGPTSIQELDLQPSSGSPGQPVTVTIVLGSASNSVTQVTLVWLLKSRFDDANSGGPPIDQGDVTLLGNLSVPPATATYVTQFTVPAVAEPIMVAAFLSDGSAAVSEFQVI